MVLQNLIIIALSRTELARKVWAKTNPSQMFWRVLKTSLLKQLQLCDTWLDTDAIDNSNIKNVYTGQNGQSLNTKGKGRHASNSV